MEISWGLFHSPAPSSERKQPSALAGSISKARQNDLLAAIMARVLSRSSSGALEVTTNANPKLRATTGEGTGGAIVAPFWRSGGSRNESPPRYHRGAADRFKAVGD